MNNELFNHIEQKIREAARHVEPPFNEAAWKKMEMKLDEEVDRRRPLFWWFLTAMLVMLGTGATFFYFQTPHIKKEQFASGQVDPHLKNQRSSNVQADKEFGNGTVNNDEISGSVSPEENGIGKHQPSSTDSGKTANDERIVDARLFSSINGGNVVEEGEQSEKWSNETLSKNEDEFSQQRLAHTVIPSSTDAEKENEAHKLEKNSATPAPQQESKTGQDSALQKLPRNKRTCGIYFLASAGPEITAVSPSLANGRDVTARFGFGMGYQFNKKLGLQTGFYSVSKKYAAGKEDYDPKDDSYIPVANDLVIDANCRVFEIPVSLRYNISTGAKTSWFVLGGVASVFMVKEHYKFTYTAGSYPYVHTDEKAFTGNRHLISFAQLSGGFSRKMSSTISLTAEPYVSFPLHGVGEGRVKVFSAGVQFGIRYMPLKK